MPPANDQFASSLTFAAEDLLGYTDWQRQQWQRWFQREGALPLEISTGPHGDGRMKTVGELIRHIFSAELRYVERIQRQSLTDAASIPCDNVDHLFQFGAESRRRLVTLIRELPTGDWERPLEFSVVNTRLRVTPRKIILHVLTHEIRHWAQVGTLLRLQGLKGDFQDLLMSPVLDVIED